MKKLCKNTLSTVKSLTNREMFMTQGAVFQSNWKQIFLREKLCCYERHQWDLRVGSVCPLLCSLFDSLWLMIPFKQAPNRALLVINRCSSPVVSVLALYFLSKYYNCALRKYMHACAHTYTHTFYFPAQMVNSLSSYKWGHRFILIH
jgi:hypothetical protein